MQRLYLLLADALLLLHALIVVFNVAAVPVIWLGYLLRWRFVRNFSFRVTHLLLIGFVAAESVLGLICPLTTWENALRVKAGDDALYPRGFVSYWVHRLIFHDLGQAVFAVGYGVFFALVFFTWVWVKPRPPRWWTRRSG